MSDLDLNAIKARAEAATPGPLRIVDLRHQRGGQIRIMGRSGDGHIIANVLASGPRPDADATFIAHAREDVPALIAEVERLREELAEAQEDIDGLCNEIANRDAQLAQLDAKIEILVALTATERVTPYVGAPLAPPWRTEAGFDPTGMTATGGAE